MIIGYYPGAGGNRYHQYINNLHFNLTNMAYDGMTSVSCRGLYLDIDNQLVGKTNYDILTHCVNYNRINQQSGVVDIVIIKANLKDCLCREWSLKGKFKPMFFPEEVNEEVFLLELYQAIKDPTWPNVDTVEDYKKLPKFIYQEVQLQFNENKAKMSQQGVYNFLTSAYTAIVWHHKLYQKYPLDPGPTKLIDIDNDLTEFAVVMRRELELYKNNSLFNFAWDVYESLGSSAPIITLYNESNLNVNQ